MVYAIEMTEQALAMLLEIGDQRVRSKLVERIGKLAVDPDKQGKPLVDELSGLRSVRAIGQRYRIIYQVQTAAVKVLVVGAGIRKEGSRTDVHARTAKRMAAREG